MDPFSHALLGAASGQAVAGRDGRAAALAGLAAALLPDADVLIGSAADPLLSLEYHRHFSHSFVAAPLIALVAAAAVWLVVRRRTPYLTLFLSGLAGAVSAILLDACTSYGTHLLWPFDDRRYAWSIVAVVDPVVTLVLLTGVVLSLRTRSALRARITILLVVAYLGLGWLQRERVEDTVLRMAAERGHGIEQLEVKPTMGNIVLWRSIYRTGDTFVVDAVHAAPVRHPVVYPGGAVRRVKTGDVAPLFASESVQLRDVERFAQQSDGYLAWHPEQPNVVGDIRYAMLPDSTRPLWGIRLDPERPDRHVDFITMRSFPAEDRRRFMTMLLGRRP